MTESILTIRELHTKLKSITNKVQHGQRFIVFRHKEALFRIEPLAKTWGKKYTLADLDRIQFSDKDKSLSKKIDSVLSSV
ncbi:hypothetical protein HZA87_06380 [Candidatus Uhrbacteria bacterium]|nr:hypothetical protein [Candidatus Uhrbacteria bacterium]